MESFQSWLSHGNIPSPWREAMEIIWSHGLPWFFKREKLPLVSFCKLVMLLKDQSNIFWRTFFWWNVRVKKKTRHFMTSSTKGNLRDSTFRKKNLSEILVFLFTTNLYGCEPPHNISFNFVQGILVDLGHSKGWGENKMPQSASQLELFGPNLDLRKAGLWRDPPKWIKNHSWLFFWKDQEGTVELKVNYNLAFLTARPLRREKILKGKGSTGQWSLFRSCCF